MKTARNILDGNVGLEYLGKVVTIYPENNQDCIDLSRELIKLTSSYRGPAIPTDVLLKGILYTRYGGINPILRQGADGSIEEYFYDNTFNLVKDCYDVPFQLPSGILWPFVDMPVPQPAKKTKVLHHIYRPTNILKPDPRGDVIKAVYLKGFLRVAPCVIKIGKANMLADDFGRDIQARLIWQKNLHDALQNVVYMPKILDFFEENGDSYLVMEFIKGKSLNDKLLEVYGNSKSWFQLSDMNKGIIVDWLLKIIDVVESLHKNGYTHRDIQPGNFIITPENRITLIDTELAYDLNILNPEPPFQLGTPGFMSPEQEAANTPTTKEDIYGLGGLMINMFTSLNAARYDATKSGKLAENLSFFIRHSQMSILIASCLHHEPSQRPEIATIRAGLERYKNELLTDHVQQPINQNEFDYTNQHINSTIKRSIKGLGRDPMPISSGIWLSKAAKSDTSTGVVQKKFAPYCGIHTGMTGVLYLLARAKTAGYELETNKSGYKESWKYLYSEHLNKLDTVSAGLYHGAAGIALSLAQGIKSGLLEDSDFTKQYIEKCLEKQPEQLNMSEGIAGQGIALLQCIPFLSEHKSQELLNNCIEQVLGSQNKSGWWEIKSPANGKQNGMSLSWSQGATGILHFLLLYYTRCKSKKVEESINKGLAWLSKHTSDLEGLFIPSIYNRLLNKMPEIGDERNSAILCFIQAYDTLKDTYFKEAAESALLKYPDFVTNNNFSQDGGMASLGEIYLDAWTTFQTKEWKNRAGQIANFFAHTSYENDSETCFWLTDETRKPVSDLLTGNCGIIHFLLRYEDPTKLGHILIN